MVWHWILLIAVSTSATANENLFKTGKIKLGNKIITVEIADTPKAQQQGLMFRQKLEANSGMLFIFDKEDFHTFWMKNTFIPLSIGYFDKNKKLTEILEMIPVTSELQVDVPRYPSQFPTQFVLEMNKNWFKNNGIKVGTTFSILKSDTKTNK